MDTTHAATIPPDPGMHAKMTDPAFRGLRDLAAGGPLSDEGAHDLRERCDYVDTRYDCADFRALVLIKTLLAWGDRLPTDLTERITTTLRRAKFAMDEPGRDGMCLWSENHQVVSAVTQYLVGQTWPEETFTNSGRTGAELRERATARLGQWLQNRFRFGFSEWLSPVYYEEDAAALAVLIDEAHDADLRERATIVLDLLLLDLALHTFPAATGARFLPSTGRVYAEEKFWPARVPVRSVHAELVGAAGHDTEWNERSLAALFHARRRYAIPDVLRAIAGCPDEVTVRSTHGLDAAEVMPQVGETVSTAGLFFWGMEAFTTRESIELTAQMIHLYDLVENPFLKPMTPFTELRGRRVLPTMVSVLNPATQGVALQRANVVTTRRRSWFVSAAQMHHPRAFGDQQHLWQVQLPGDVSVFSTHPAEPFFEQPGRDFSPSWWVGNGRQPYVAADANAVLVFHDLSGRAGYLEAPRLLTSHLHWPRERFDETRRGLQWVAGRVGDSYVGVLGSGDLLDGSIDEIRQEGTYTAWATFCSDAAEVGRFEWFVAGLTRSAMRVATKRGRRTLELQTDPLWEPARERWQWRVGPDGFWIDDARVDVDHPRLAGPFGQVGRDPAVIGVEHDGHALTLTWADARREVR